MRVFAIVAPRGKVGRTYPLIFEPKVPLESPLDSTYLRGVRRPERPVELVREAGTGTCDIHSLIHMLGYVVSPAFCSALSACDCTGWSTYPVVAHDRKGAVLPGYKGLVVTGRATRIDRSHVRETRVSDPLGYMRTVWVGYQVVESSWDGSDVFLVLNPDGGMGLEIFLSERGAAALTSKRLRGFTVEPVDEVQWSLAY